MPGASLATAAHSATHAAATQTPPSSTPSSAQRHTTLAARVTADILAALQNGVRPWQQPWHNATALALPLRANGTPYQGINILALWAASAKHGFTARHWLSFNQARVLGGAVRKGARATHIVLYKPRVPAAAADDSHNDKTEDRTDAAAQPRRALLRTYAVFNADQTEGLPGSFYAPPPNTPDPDATQLTAVLARVPATITHGGGRACYNPVRDVIHMPPRTAFVSAAQYCATLLHELGHWSGHASRLDRQLQPRTSVLAYAREELTAELCSAFLGAELGLPVDHIEDHAAYIDSWLKLLDHEPQALLTAAAQAQRAADFLRTFLHHADADTTPA